MRGNSSSFAHVFMSVFAMWKPTLFETNRFETNKFERIRFGKNRNKRSFVISFLKEAAMSIGRAKKDKQLMCRCVLRGKGLRLVKRKIPVTGIFRFAEFF